MITHVVVFWTDKPVEENRQKLLAKLEPLAGIPGVKNFRCGPAIESPRGAVDDSYTVAISMDFETAADAEVYQTHPLHVDFIKTCIGTVAKRFVVYDFGV
ncbi:Dabb family protein [Ruficoccus amylovorans]|uniref:Dabb family protein n=1 Tax=Ruficoccus amylovorans TaxID=1804625 RepID=A0A842HIQ4_9BACT|nr:Dabb family protein [Ruficoccus amylovorans]MBC2595397.1 Dabb family protein [Ruficoccus amylovorans]